MVSAEIPPFSSRTLTISDMIVLTNLAVVSARSVSYLGEPLNSWERGAVR